MEQDKINIEEARMKLVQRMANRTGGKGSRRMVKKLIHHVSGRDNRLRADVRSLGLVEMKGIQETNLFTNDGFVYHFRQFQVHINIQSHCTAIFGIPEYVHISTLLPDVLPQLGREFLEQAETIASSGLFDSDFIVC